jgi:hypothetical protein
VTRRSSIRGVVMLLVVVTSACGGRSGIAPEASSPATSRPAALHEPAQTTSPPQGRAEAVDLAATPRGWVPVDYADAQVSVPFSWNIWDGCAPSRQGSVFLTGVSPIEKVVCTGAADLVEIAPLSDSARGPYRVINGITAYGIHGVWNVPSLGVQVSVVGPLGASVLNTLTHSPRSVATRSPTAPAIPAHWHRVVYGGLSLAVPASWPVEQTSQWAPGCTPRNVSLSSTAVFLDSGTTERLEFCPPTSTPLLTTPKDGLFIDPGPYGPLPQTAQVRSCLHLNGLTACPATADVYGVLVMAVHSTSRTRTVTVEIGLAGDGTVARTILDSMRTG